MNNIFNSRVKRLIKADLLEYVKYLFGFFGLAVVIPIVLNLLFGTSGEIGIGIGNLNINIADFGRINIGGIFNFISFGFFVFVMFIAGITAGSELPQHIRVGIARKEYFIATIVSAVIVSLLIAPFVLLLNIIVNSLITPGSLFYNTFHIGGGEISILTMQFLMYTSLFLLGYCGAIICQRVGWLIGVAIIVAVFIILGFLGWNIAIGFNMFNLTIGDHWFEIETSSDNGFFSIMGILTTAVLGIGTYMLIKNVSVKVR